MSIVVDTPYNSTRGRKPSRPAFLFDFHNDAAGGTAIVDRFGNARDLTLAGTLGTSWTGSRGFWRPNGTDQHALMSSGTGEDYAAQDVMADGLLTLGGALFIHYRLGWVGTKTAANEVALCLGRNAATSAAVLVGVNSGGSINIVMRGVGASATSAGSWGASSLTENAKTYSMALLLTPIADGFTGLAWLNGVPVGLEQTFMWTGNSGATPTRATFAMPDGVTVGAQRAGSSPSSPSFTQRVGVNTSGGSVLANVMAIHLATSSVGTAGDLALELTQYPRAIGEIMGAL